MSARKSKAAPAAPVERVKDDPLRVSATHLASIMGVSRTAVMKWVDEEGAPCESRGTKGLAAQFFLPAFIEWWTERVRRKAESDSGATKLAQRKEEIELARLELKYRQEAKEVLPRSVFVQVVRDVGARLQVQMRQLPQNEAHAFVGLESKDTVEALLRAAMDAIAAECRRSDFWRPIFGTADLFNSADEM
ncbi:hypothetical protein [Gemmatimonas sp.]